MHNFIKIIAIGAVIGIVIISSLFVLDVVDASEMKEYLQKTLFVLSIVALGGIIISALSKPKA